MFVKNVHSALSALSQVVSPDHLHHLPGPLCHTRRDVSVGEGGGHDQSEGEARSVVPGEVSLFLTTKKQHASLKSF